jgi:nitrite reductase/ring-hydroxylating ferredoxin subunit
VAGDDVVAENHAPMNTGEKALVAADRDLTDKSGPDSVGSSTRLRVCASSDLVDQGLGVRFDLGPDQPAFAIRWEGVVQAYLNRCAHVPVELDWLPGQFLDDRGVYLVCATHGALYEPSTGACVEGPCRNQHLRKLPAVEHEGSVWVDLSHL